jgi:hypothetical protein
MRNSLPQTARSGDATAVAEAERRFKRLTEAGFTARVRPQTNGICQRRRHLRFSQHQALLGPPSFQRISSSFPDHGAAAVDVRKGVPGIEPDCPFVAALVKHLPTPGVEINKLFRLVRDDVLAATGPKQEPFVYGSLPGDDFFFVAAMTILVACCAGSGSLRRSEPKPAPSIFAAKHALHCSRAPACCQNETLEPLHPIEEMSSSRRAIAS